MRAERYRKSRAKRTPYKGMDGNILTCPPGVVRAMKSPPERTGMKRDRVERRETEATRQCPTLAARSDARRGVLQAA